MDPLAPQTLVAGRFEIERAVAPACGGDLYVALDRTAQKQISFLAIETPVARDAAKAGALASDVKASTSLGAPSLAIVHDAGADTDRGLVWVAMDLVEGEGLAARIARGGVTPREAVGIVRALLDALAPAHARGQVHRALSPDDVVLVPGDGDAKVIVLGFGLGKHLLAREASVYVAPEQARASGWVTPAADVFSLGAIAYELIAGSPPAGAPLAQAAPATPTAVAAIVDKALSGDPGLRFASAKEMKAALDAAIAPPAPVATAAPFAAPAGGGFGPPGPMIGGASAPFAMPRAAAGLPTPTLASGQQADVVPPGVGAAAALPPPKSASTTWMWVVGLVVLLGGCILVPVGVGVAVFIAALSADHAAVTPPPTDPSDPFGVGGTGPLVPDPNDPLAGGGGLGIQGGGLGPAPAGEPRYDVPVTGAQPQKGPPDALVTIVEFADFQCPFCGRVAPTMDSLLDSYGTDVRLVWRDQPLPFHEHAGPAAEVGREAFAERGNAGFWQVHDLFYANQQALEESDLLRYASQAGLDANATRRAITSQSFDSAIQLDATLGNQIGADGTPTFFVNGRRVVGAQPREEFVRVIDEELATARQMVASGTPRAAVYTTLMRTALDRYVDAAAPPTPPDNGGGADPNQVYTVANNPSAPSRGPANAAVTITEFSDFQCPFCNRARTTLDALRSHYGSRVRIVWRDYPLEFHTNAHLAAEAAREALAQGGDAKFWRMHDLLYDHQDALERADLERYARQIGLDMGRFRAALDDHTHSAEIQADIDAANNTGVSMGTPTFFVNGHLIAGAQPLATFETAVDTALAAPQNGLDGLDE